MKSKHSSKTADPSPKSFDDFIQDCRNYGLSVTRERLITSLHQFSHQSYRFAMSPDAKTMIVLLESGELDDDL